MRRRYLRYLLLGIASVALASVIFPSRSSRHGRPRTYEEIIASDTLRVTTEYNSVSFHVRGDSLEGFHYELARAFAHDKGLQLQVLPEMSIGRQIEGICRGEYDLIANGLLVTVESKDSLLLFTEPILKNKQVLVQRKHQEGDSLTYVRNQLDLGGKTVYISSHSSIAHRIHNLSHEIGDTIFIHEEESYGEEQLLFMVAHGDIDYAVCEEHIASRLLPDFPQLDIATQISFNQFYAWGVSRESTALRDTLNAWLTHYMQQPAYRRLLKKYKLK